MTNDDVKREGYTKPVWLSRCDHKWYYREASDKPAVGKEEREALMDRLGCVVALSDDGHYFDLPIRPLWLGSDGGTF